MKSLRLWVVGVAVVITLGGGWRVFHGPATSSAASSQSQPPEVPVTVATAKVRNVPLYLDGIGTVQAFNTVQVKAQVNGILVALPAHEGQEVRQGDVVAEIDPAPYKAALDQAEAQRAEDEAQLQSAQLDLRRYQSLAKSSFAPIQQVDDQQAIVNKDIASVEADTAVIETAQINLGYCTIRAPFAGRVSLYQTDVGNLIQANGQTGIISIDQDKPIAVVFTLPEAELPQVQAGRAHGVLPVQVFSSDARKPLSTGSLMTPNNSIDTTTGTISLKARFDNDGDHLWPGQFVNVRLQVDTLQLAITIPSLAIQHGPDGLYVFQVKPDHTVAQTTIQVGYQDGGLAVVTRGLSSDAMVVVSGQYRLAPGTRVKTIPTSDPSHAPTGAQP
jgi:membrane fusion protein, multidrug efflux system